jgi:hypothetical protein
MGLAKTSEDATISGNSPALKRAIAQNTLRAPRFASCQNKSGSMPSP